MTSKDGYALDTFIVLEPDGQPVSGDRLNDLCERLTETLEITTIGERVEDFFSLTNADNQPLSAAQQAELRAKIIAEFKQPEPE